MVILVEVSQIDEDKYHGTYIAYMWNLKNEYR